MREMLVLMTAATSSLLTTVWHKLAHRHLEIKEHRAMCRHQWGEPFSLYDMGEFWMQNCPACGAQKHINQDGSDYVPGQEENV